MSKITSFDYYVEDKVQKADIEFRMLSCDKSLEFLMFLGKAIGGQVGKAISSFDINSLSELKDVKEENINVEKISNSILGIFDRLDRKEAIENLNLILSSARHGGNVLSLDYHIFDGNPDVALKVAKRAIEVNYSRFLQGILQSTKEALGRLQAKGAQVG